MKQIETVNAEKSKYAVYLARAEQNLDGAEDDFAKNRYDRCASSAVHCAISAADAVCIFKLGLRLKSKDHSRTVDLLRRLSSIEKDELETNARRLDRLISVKTDAEYGDHLIKRDAAEKALLDARRFFEFAKSVLSC